MKIILPIGCALIASGLWADAAADAVMLRRPDANTAVEQVAVEPAVKTKVKAETPAAAESVPEAEAEKEVQPSAVAEVNVEKPAPEKNAEKAEKKPQRDAVITAERTDYDRKEGVALFDRNVYVNDEQYQMHADRLFLFLDGTNDLKRLVAIGNVAITNENKRAYCARATFNKKLGRIVMYSSDEITAELREEGKKGSDVKGEKITFWLDSEQVEVENPVITMPGGFGGKGELKNMLGK
jgi:lipopolysaccharide transport protein LptA